VDQEVTNYLGVELTPIAIYIQYLNAHPDVAIKGVQNINQNAYLLNISGMVYHPQLLSYNNVVTGYPERLQVATLPCVEGWSVTPLWTGVSIMDLLNGAGGVGPDANTVIFYAADGYSSSLPLQYVKDNNLIIAYKMNNITLTPQLGWPFFLVAKSQYGYKWVEWITEINVSNNSNYLGYWESRGYPNNATVRGFTESSPSPLLVSAAALTAVSAVSVAAVVLVRRRRVSCRWLCFKTPYHVH
jgi:DMSO/TMAO reductase YedYZ molybdopterin-dependent catalytic subunit